MSLKGRLQLSLRYKSNDKTNFFALQSHLKRASGAAVMFGFRITWATTSLRRKGAVVQPSPLTARGAYRAPEFLAVEGIGHMLRFEQTFC